ncbi:hypothetical protein Cs7R123_41110 [Catellatospora sp. TT07R-123]|uniref:FG-GAP-like repeat-containing protein n=1 Tax=Catellatospora sp. TT07R-123 TaxID=2733863 RepID=UPI001B02FC69|nr:FG-GAP-like repeat-containing protein [Catellatospora sp. TT07R-123]GHJ46769.1 hypothetical protein Cs7R123_41110 [Catellatospora sp. TT07R-123]
MRHRARRHAGAVALAVAVLAVLSPGLPEAASAAAVAPWSPSAPSRTSVPVGTVTAKAPPANAVDLAKVTTIGRRTLPAGGTGTVAADGRAASVGGLTVTVAAPAVAAAATATAKAAPVSKLAVTVMTPSQTAAAGVRGALFTVARADGRTGAAPVSAAFDYRAFANAYGADFGSRLRLVSLPDCALTTPAVAACQTPTPVPSRNDGSSVSATLTVSATATAQRSATSAPGGATVLALMSGPVSGSGVYNATDLSEAYSWSAGTQGGSFTTRYPIRVPTGLGGPQPDLAITYDSGVVDAQTLSQNAQTSWLGSGWDLQSGFVEESFRSCARDGGTTGDMCDFSPYNATMLFGGRSVDLVWDGTTWHASADTGLKIEHLTGATGNRGDNGTHDKAYWKVTTQDGTQYFFGANYRYAGDTRPTRSAQWMPVYGNNTGEQCHQSTFAASWCQRGYRWNLDYVVDTSGNSMSYFYSPYTSYVGANNNTNVQLYVVTDTLTDIEYGQRAGTEATTQAPARVHFNLGQRCIDDPDQCHADTTDYPDTPFDLYCGSSSSCPNNLTPTFWTRYQVKNIWSDVWSGTAWRHADTYNMTYHFPDNGDGTSPQLWLDSIGHNGYAPDGVTFLADPTVTTDGVRFTNRVDFDAANGRPEMRRWRVKALYNGAGGETFINYWGTPCVSADIPSDPSQNTKPCFPQTITLDSGATSSGWFQKRWVSRVTQMDLTGGSPDEQWDYTYSTAGSTDDVLWHITTDEMSPVATRTWSQFNGYNTVTVTHGATGGPQTVTTSRYFRGMDKDAYLNGGGVPVWNARQVQVTDSQGVKYADAERMQGMLLEQTHADGAQVLSSTIHTYASTLTATRAKPEPTGADVRAYIVKDVADRTRTWLPQTSTWRWIENDTSYDAYDLATDQTSLGDVATTADDTCTHTDYNRNPAAGIVGTVSQVVQTDCAVTAATTLGIGANSYDSVALADITGDGKKDLVYRTPDGRIWMGARTTGTGIASFSAPVVVASTYWPWAYPNMYFADLTGDGKADIITRDSNGNLFEYVNQGSSTFGARTAAGTGYTPTGYPDLAFADLTGDGKADLQARSGDDLFFYLNNGATPVSWTNKTQTGSGAWSTYSWIGLAEVTGDSKADLLARNSAGNLIQFTNMGTNGAGMWSTTKYWVVSGAFSTPTALAAGDLTADGKADIIGRDPSGTLTQYTDTGTTTTAAFTYAAPPATALTGRQVYYDGATSLTTAPTKGLPTLAKALATVSGQTLTWAQSAKTGYDANGRTVDDWDAVNRNTHTAYALNAAGQMTTMTVTNPLGWTSVSAIEPGHGSVTSVVDANGKTTTIAYDALGRTSKVWQNNRSSTLTPDQQYTYVVSSTAPSWVQTQTLGPTGTQISSYTIYDGRLRPRQTQTPTPVANGGRVITDTAYDGRGLTAKTSTFYNTATGPSGVLATFADAAVPTQDRFTYDNLERPTVDAFYSADVQKWTTTTAYAGDRITVVPPTGAMPSTKVYDTAGNATELRQYLTTSTTGPYQATAYLYDRLGRLTTTTDSVGNSWTSTFDPRGRVVAATDPDSGASTATYDDAGQVLTSTDARPVTTAFAYDALGRPVDTYLTTLTGTHLDHWTYDTLAKGQPTTSTEYRGTTAYTTSVTGYDDAYRPLGSTVTVPAAEGTALAGAWTSTTTYNVDGSTASVTYPAAGGLAAETVNNVYDANGYLLTTAGLDTYVSGTGYQWWGEVYQQTLGTGTKRVQVTTDAWADTHRPKLISVGTEHSTTPGTYDEQLTQQYNWTPAGTLASVDGRHAGATTDSQCHTYDHQQRLTVAFTTTPALGGCAATPSTSTVGGPAAYWQTYTYDATGNRKTLVSHGLAGAADTTSTYTYPAAGGTKPHTLTGVSTTGPGGTTANSYTYGTVGQQLTSTVAGLASDFTLTYQGRTQTVTVHAVGGDQTTTYLYDASGNEILRDAPTDRTLYLGGTEVTANAAGTATTGAVRYYTAGGHTVGSRSTSGGLSWLAGDHQGTTQLAVNQTTQAVTIRRQDPFGNPRGTAPNWPNPHGFVGGTAEPAGLVHLGARLYDPATGRFTSDDPVTDVTDPQSLNGYAYADNSPLTLSDPTGRNACSRNPEECKAAPAPPPPPTSGQLCRRHRTKSCGPVVVPPTGVDNSVDCSSLKLYGVCVPKGPYLRDANIANGADQYALGLVEAQHGTCTYEFSTQIVCFNVSGIQVGDHPQTIGDVLLIPYGRSRFDRDQQDDKNDKNALLNCRGKDCFTPKEVDVYAKDLLAHEANHSSQWTLYHSVNGFMTQYVLWELASHHYANCDFASPGACNPFEISANPWQGGYWDLPTKVNGVITWAPGSMSTDDADTIVYNWMMSFGS